MSARALGAAATLLASCGIPRLVTVPRSDQPPTAQPVTVDYPPPPAKIEEIPLSARAGNRCVWRDGFWDWAGRRWEWQPGRAVLSPPGCRFADMKLEWSTDSLSFYRPAWYPDPTARPAPQSCLEVACIPNSTAAESE